MKKSTKDCFFVRSFSKKFKNLTLINNVINPVFEDTENRKLDKLTRERLKIFDSKKLVIFEKKKEDFFKALMIKNSLKLDNCVFLYGDLVSFLDLNYTNLNMAEPFGFNLFKNWHNDFHLDKLSIAAPPCLPPDPRIEILSKRIPLAGLRILELGCLEGLHSLNLQSFGAAEVTAIEGKAGNFLKSLVVKNAFNLDRCSFILGDLRKVITNFKCPFDVCVALGILYHLREPFSVIYRIAQLTDNLFAWTHYSNNDFPNSPLVEINYAGRRYRGKYICEDTRFYLSGLENKSFWIYEEDIPRVLNDSGFKHIEIINKEKAKNGPAVTFLARK